MMSCRIVLPVAVHGGDHRRGGGDHGGAQRGTLARAPSMAEIAQLLVAAEHGLDLGVGAVVACVIDHDHFLQNRLRHGGNGLLDQPPDIAGLVISRDDDGDTHGQISGNPAPRAKGPYTADQ